MAETKRIHAKGKKRINRSLWGDIVVFILLLMVALFMALPFVYTVIQAFKPFEELFAFPPKFYVVNPTIDNFIDLFMVTANSWVPFSRYIFNSVFVSLIGTSLHVICASLCAYPIAKHNFPGKKGIFKVIQLSLLFNGTVTALPTFIIMSELGLLNNHLSIILPAIGGAFGMFLMKQFMEGIPTPLLEAGRIDGAGEWKIFWRIVMPNVKPAWLTLIIFSFTGLWNNGGGSYIFDEELKMLPTALTQIASVGIARMGVGMAASLLLIIPPIFTFIISQSRIIETMSTAGIK